MFRQITDVAWTPQATPTSPTATSIRASQKIDKDGNWLSPGRTRDQSDSSTLRTASRLMRTIAFTSRTAAIDASSLRHGRKFLRQSPSMFPSIPTRAPPSATSPRHHRTMAPGAPWAICITPGPNQVLYSSDGFPGRIYKLSSRWKSSRRLRQVRQATRPIRLVHEIACPPKTNCTLQKS